MSQQEKKRQKRIKDFVIERDGSICCYCDKVLIPETITMEHILADSHRGTFNSTNLTVACAPCNNKRGNKPFFDYCKQFQWSKDKIDKYKRLYFANLKIKVLNIAKENCITTDQVIPHHLIKASCLILKIKLMDFSEYERDYVFDIIFSEICERNKIKPCFEQIIRIIEMESK